MLRILGGEFRSRRLSSPPDARTTRPMAARVKESIFNLLRGWCEDANVLDLFAGVGTMGLEAVSRGARRVVMVEQSKPTARILQQNIDELKCGDRASVIVGDALSPTILSRAPSRVDLLFLDPPYIMTEKRHERQRVLEQVRALRPILAEKSMVVLRTPRLEDHATLVIEGFDGPETHRYGNEMFVHLYMPVTQG